MTIIQEVENKVKHLDEETAHEVLKFINALLNQHRSQGSNLKHSKQDKPWMELAGVLKDEDALKMKTIIEEECERIDYESW